MSTMLLEAYEAMGTKFWVEIYDTPALNSSLKDGGADTNPLDEVKENIVNMLTDFEKKYSRFDTMSLLNQYNRGEVKYDDLDDEFKDILAKSEYYMSITDNTFDIYIQDKLVEKGYGCESFNLQNKNIDFGGIGKGYIIDKIALTLKEKFDIKYFLINGGGDMYMTSDNGQPITVYMQHPLNDGEYIDIIQLKDKAFCASSSFKRVWTKHDKDAAGDKVNHFITSDGSEVWAASYIIADDTVTADVAATVACILSVDANKLVSVMNRMKVEYFVIDRNGSIIRRWTYSH